MLVAAVKFNIIIFLVIVFLMFAVLQKKMTKHFKKWVNEYLFFVKIDMKK